MRSGARGAGARAWICAAAGTAALCLATTAAAQTNLLQKVLPHEDGRALCYASKGDPVEFGLENETDRPVGRTLAVKRFVFLLRAGAHEPDESLELPGDVDPRYYRFLLAAEPVDRQGRLSATGECGSDSPDGFGCGVECDGGSVAFELAPGGEGLLLRISSVAQRFRMTWGCGGGSERYAVLTYDAATPAVHLVRTDPAVCTAIERAIEQKRAQ